ncbi:MAG: hypothetical protein [Caudoviricetes sp.]|nr:MAG: hypothetical protein [Caudoviricetes sp.]
MSTRIRGSGLGSVITENNSTKFQLEVKGSHRDNPLEVKSALAGLYINGKIVDETRNRGINIVVIDSKFEVVEVARYDIYGAVSEIIDAFIKYIDDAPTDRIIALYSYDAMGTNDKLDQAFNRWGASTWPSSAITVAPRSSYVALYSTKHKSIFCDAKGNLASKSEPAYIEYFLDSFEDIATVGGSRFIAYDSKEYEGTNKYGFKSWYDRQPLSNLGNVKPGDMLNIQAEGMVDDVAKAAGVKLLVTMQFYNEDLSWNSAISFTIDSLDWSPARAQQVIPADAFAFDLGAYHWPNTTTDQGSVFVRNLIAQPMAPYIDKNLNARFGRRVVPTENFIEDDLGTVSVRMLKDDKLEVKDIQEESGGSWIKVYQHYTLDGQKFFENEAQAIENDTPYLYSDLLRILDNKLSHGKYRFKLVAETIDLEIVWEQSSSPFETTVEGFKLLSTTQTLINPLTGLRRYTQAAENGREFAYLTGVDSPDWWYPVGLYVKYGDKGIPVNGVSVAGMQLYVFTD